MEQGMGDSVSGIREMMLREYEEIKKDPMGCPHTCGIGSLCFLGSRLATFSGHGEQYLLW